MKPALLWSEINSENVKNSVIGKMGSMNEWVM